MTAPAVPQDHERLGILCMLASGLLFAITNVLIKQLSGAHPTTEIMFFRNLFALPVALLLVVHAGGLHLLKTQQIGGHVLRGGLGLCAMGLLFFAFAHLPVADTIAIYFVTPLIILLLSGRFLGETVRLGQWIAAVVGLIGVMFIVRPSGDGIQIGALAALGSCIFYAIVALLLRRLSRTEPTATITWYYALFCTLATLPFAPFGWTVPTPGDFGLFLLLGLCGGGAQYFLTHSFRNARASLVAPFDYAQLLWTIAGGWIVFGEIPTWASWTGAALIVGSGLYVLRKPAA
jgi:drug/metabolite transporter (DMT)-like permease